MTTATLTPGVYVEEDATPSISVGHSATAIPLFIGRFIARDGNYDDQIIRISSWLDFTRKFSDVDQAGITLSPKTDNKEESKNKDKENPLFSQVPGSEQTQETLQCSVKVEPSNAAAIQLYFQNGGGTCYLFCIKTPALTELSEKIKEIEDITLLVCIDNDETTKKTVYTKLNTLLAENKQGYFLLADSNDGKTVPAISESMHVAAYYPALITTLSPRPDDRLVRVTGYPVKKEEPAVRTLADLKKKDPELAREACDLLTRALEPMRKVSTSAVMAGVCAATDRSRGVWKAPANVVLNGVAKTSVTVTDDMQGEMNQAGINVIRHFTDRGVVVWGARTLKDSDDWRYIPVRRLFNSAERDIKKAMQPMVFEPNAQPTWKRVSAAVENYLHGLWKQGALAGNTPEEAYFVQIGRDITMTQAEIDQGKMVVKIGMAAVRPAEFIVLQFTQSMAQ